MRKVNSPQIAVAGLSLELYHRTFPGFDKMLEKQFSLFCREIKPHADIRHGKICFLQGHVEEVIKKAESMELDALLLVPMCYTASLMTSRPVLKTTLPLIVWNTQEAETINDSFDFDVLLKNHVPQGTQDLTNVLLRSNRIFGMESGHCRDKDKLEKLGEWFRAARAFRFAGRCNAGLLGLPFQDMGDLGVDETAMLSKWGPCTVHLGTGRFLELIDKVTEKEIRNIISSDRKIYDISSDVTADIHGISVKLEIAMRRLMEENELDAFSMNFREFIQDGRVPAMPFLGINKLMGEGLGYAGEGDIAIAALISQMRQLAGIANFTEIYTLDYKQNLMVMTHMQECNPAMARKNAKIKLDEPVGDFLNRYSMAGGTHHIAAMPGKHAGAVTKLARFHGFELKNLNRSEILPSYQDFVTRQ